MSDVINGSAIKAAEPFFNDLADLEAKLLKKLILLSCLIPFVYLNVGISGTTGKLVGVVMDKSSEQPLAGVNIEILKTSLGAASDKDGYYLINNIPPGTYTVRATYLGYRPLEVNEVVITVDKTTEINIKMQESVLELDETITVTAEKPLIRKDITSKRAVVNGEMLTDILPVSTLNEAISMQAGIVSDENGNIHIRGGRLGEVAYLVDGTYVRDPFDNDLGGKVDIEAIQEMEVISGTFNAEYGNAMSGVVNIVTKEGTPEYKYKIQVETPMLNESPYHQPDWLLDADFVEDLPPEEKEKYKDAVRKEDGSSAYEHLSVIDKFPSRYTVVDMLGKLNGSVSGPLPFFNKIHFFVSGTFENEDSYLPYGFNLDRVVSTKLSYRPIESIKVQFNYDWSNRWYQLYNHQYKYWMYFDERGEGSYPIWADFKNRQTLKLNHTLNNATFYNASLSRVYNYASRSIVGRTVRYDEDTGELIETDYLTRGYYAGAEGNFRNGDDRYWYRTESTTYDLDFDITSQVNRYNQLKGGFEYRVHDIFRHRIGMPPRSRLQFFNEDPMEMAVYLQDKIELSYLVVNVGLRFDYFNANAFQYPNVADILVTRTNEEGETILTTIEQEKTEPQYKLSPRIGLAHPITETTIFHFAYGHFFQTPSYYDLYRNSAIENLLANDALVGNPGLKPEETVAFEAGFKQQLGNDYSLDVTAYYKDITNLISSFYYFSGRDYTIFINADFGRVKGVDITLNKQYSNYFNGALNYTYMIAKGNESDPYEGYSNYREEDAHLKPNRNFYLDYDRRHSFNLNLGVRLPDQFGPTIFGVNILQNLSSNVTLEAASGLPYTPASRDPEATVLPEKNSARKDWTKQLDMRINKLVRINNLEFNVYTRIINAFDWINDLRVWSRTGDPWDQGPTSNYTEDRQANPENVDIRRMIKAGIILRF